MTCWLLVACDEKRKHHFIDKSNNKTSKTMKNANNEVKVGVKVNMPNFLHSVFSDVDLIMCNKTQRQCILRWQPMLR